MLERFQHPLETRSDSGLGEEIKIVARAIFKRAGLIASIVLLSVLGCIAYLWVTDVEYVSTSEILIDPRAKQILERQVAPTGLGSSAIGADTSLMESQIEIIGSSSVLDKVIAANNLAGVGGDDTKAGNETVSMVKSWLRWIFRGPKGMQIPNETKEDLALRELRQALRVERRGNTYVVGISVTSTDRFQAADIANSISRIYVQENEAGTRAIAQEAADSLSGRLKALEAEATAADNMVVQYKAENGLTDLSSNVLVEQSLRELSSLMTAAKSAALDAEIDWNLISDASPADLRAISGESPTSSINVLATQLTAAQTRESTAREKYLDRHPLVRAASRERKLVEKAIADELARTRKLRKAKYETTNQKVEEISSQIAALEAKSAELRVASVKLNELQAEANLRSDLLKSFKSNALQAEQQIGLPSNTVRVIARATPASLPAKPKVALLLFASTALGLLLGTLLAWALHVLNGSEDSSGNYI